MVSLWQNNLPLPLFLFLAEVPFPREDRENVSKKKQVFFSLLEIRENVSNNSSSSSNSDDDDDDNEWFYTFFRHEGSGLFKK